GHGAGAAIRGALQSAGRVGNHRLGHGARGARQRHAGCGRHRRDDRRGAESKGRRRGAPRRPGRRAARPRPCAKRSGMSGAARGGRLLENLLIFGRVLRRAGIDVHPGRLLDVIEALGYVDLGSRDEVYHTCRALLVHRHDQIAIFDRAFAVFWRDHHDLELRREPSPSEAARSATTVERFIEIDEAVTPSGDEADDEAAGPERAPKTWSDVDMLATKDFAAFTVEEVAKARMALS